MLRVYRLLPQSFSFKSLQAYNEALFHFQKYHRPIDFEKSPELYSDYSDNKVIFETHDAKVLSDVVAERIQQMHKQTVTRGELLDGRVHESRKTRLIQNVTTRKVSSVLPHISVLLAPNFDAAVQVLHSYILKSDEKKVFLDRELAYCVFLRLKAHLVHLEENSANAGTVTNQTGQQVSEALRWVKFLYLCHDRECQDIWDLKHQGHDVTSTLRTMRSPFRSHLELQSAVLDCCRTHEDVRIIFDFMKSKGEYTTVQNMWGLYCQKDKFHHIEQCMQKTMKLKQSTHGNGDIVFDQCRSLLDEMHSQRSNHKRMRDTFLSTILSLALQTGRNWRFILDYYENVPRLFEREGHNQYFLDLIREATKRQEFELLEWLWPCLPDSIEMSYDALRIIMEHTLYSQNIDRFMAAFVQYEELLRTNSRYFSKDKFAAGQRLLELAKWMYPMELQQMNQLYSMILQHRISSNALVTACMVTFARLGEWKQTDEIYHMLRSQNIPISTLCYAYLFNSCFNSSQAPRAMAYFADMMNQSTPIRHEAIEEYMNLSHVTNSHEERSAWIDSIVNLINERQYVPGSKALMVLMHNFTKEDRNYILDTVVGSIQDPRLRAHMLANIKEAKTQKLHKRPPNNIYATNEETQTET